MRCSPLVARLLFPVLTCHSSFNVCGRFTIQKSYNQESKQRFNSREYREGASKVLGTRFATYPGNSRNYVKHAPRIEM